MQGTLMLPEQSKCRQKQNVNKRFQETATGTTTDDASQIKAEDLRKQNRTGFYKRFLKLLQKQK
jgi:hypothetical protein